MMSYKGTHSEMGGRNLDDATMPEGVEQPPLVSVLIPLYNHEKYIADCIDSIVAQDYQNIEIVLVDDASTDCGLQVAKNMLSSCDIAYTILKNPFNRGICATLNRAVQSARGKYACIIASDDLLARGRIERHVRILHALTDPRVVACHGPLQVMDEEKTCLSQKGILKNNDRYTLGSVVKKIDCPTLQGCTFEISFLKNFPFDEELFFEDWDLFIRLFLSEYNVVYDKQVSAHYRQHAAGANRSVYKMVEARNAIRHKHFNTIAEKDINLARAFDFTIAFANMMSIAYTGRITAWTVALAKLLIKNPRAVLTKTRTIAWSFRILLRSR